MIVDESKAQVVATCRAAIGEAPAALVEAMLAGLRPSVRLVPAALEEAADRDEHPGRSRIGGLPDLPADLPWPVFRGLGGAPSPRAQEWASHIGHPMSFVAQIDLAELAALDPAGALGIAGPLPRRGFLYFFYTDAMEVFDLYPEHGAIAAALWADVPREALRYTLRPSELDADEVYSGFPVAPRLEWTLPPPHAIPGVEPADVEAHLEVYDVLVRRIAAVQGFRAAQQPRHRLLGHPDLVQSMALPAGERLLFQLDSDAPWAGLGYPRTGMMWGDAGRVYFTIRGEDLDAGRIDRASAFFECS